MLSGSAQAINVGRLPVISLSLPLRPVDGCLIAGHHLCDSLTQPISFPCPQIPIQPLGIRSPLTPLAGLDLEQAYELASLMFKLMGC